MRRNNKQKLAISLFILALLSIGLVYAYLTSNLSITGSTEISANSWDIHFANLNVTEGSVEATTPAAINPSDNTSITYTVKLNRPKDFYEFTVDVVNAGSLPGKVDISTVSGITSEAEDIVDYSVNYTNDTPVQIGDILNGGATKSIKVRVYYKDDIDADDLPDSNINLTLTFTLQYVQSESDEDVLNPQIRQLINDNTSCFTKYTGQVTDQVGVTKTNAENVYYNRCADKRNIIFNNMCWQMIRTTETGGIKMIYNGDVVDGKCLNTRGNHKGIVQSNYGSLTLSASYLYGSSFTYDITNNTFTLTDTETATWSNSTYENLIGKFTCKSNSDTCATLYSVNGYSNNTSAWLTYYAIGDTNYAQIGKSSFNANYHSPAMVGYMFNKVYNSKSKTMTSTETMLSNSSLATTYWYASSYEYGNPVASKYNLVDAYQISSTSDYSSLVGKYTFRNSTQSYTNTSIYYIVAVNGTNMYYIQLLNGRDLADYNHTYTYGDSYTDNGNGTYTINSPTTINRLDWYTNYANVNNKYVCKNATNNTCSVVWYITNTTNSNMIYIPITTNTYKYGSSFTYDENTNKYTLSNTISFWNMVDSENQTSINTHHYTCWNDTGTCETISYIYSIYSGTPDYINLTGGKSVNDALNEMLYNNDVNRYNSSIKGIIDAWYRQNLSSKTNMLEDTVYCNARNTTSLGGWNPKGSTTSNYYIKFKNYTSKKDISCANETDQFAVSNNKAKLTYPVSLATYEELHTLTNNNSSTYYSVLTKTGAYWWGLSPDSFSSDNAYVRRVSSDGFVNFSGFAGDASGVRLVVSLSTGAVISSGDGSEESPFVISE